jgi:hypothetical protein
VTFKLALSIAVIGLTANAFAQQTTEPAAPEVAPAAVESAPAEQPAVTPPNTVPKLNITWDCGGCEINEKVPPLVDEAFRAEAHKRGFSISETESVNARIFQFRQRPPGLRIAFGMMSGKDRLGLRIDFKGQVIEVANYWANAWQGQNSLTEIIGKEIFAKISALNK